MSLGVTRAGRAGRCEAEPVLVLSNPLVVLARRLEQIVIFSLSSVVSA